ncbi:type I methionyl aminopeptidase [Candidatus Peregrinibacteria bacterium]|nr:type I methionyl aminopeptidase [Candidatus Peregrinibacteria bacterium]
MAITIKTEEEILYMKIGGKILAEVLQEILKRAREGVSTYELDIFAEEFIRDKGGIPAFKGYHGFPATLCTAINEVIVHGIPKKDEFLKNGDLLTIDSGVIYKDLYTDAARSIGIGEISKEKERLLKTAKMALSRATDIAKPNTHLNEIGKIIEATVKKEGFHVIHNLTGHGVGRKLHEEPIVLNYWEGKSGPLLQPGMTLAIEPIFSAGTSEMETLKDNWTIVTVDRSTAVQEENTILITESGNEILTEI